MKVHCNNCREEHDATLKDRTVLCSACGSDSVKFDVPTGVFMDPSDNHNLQSAFDSTTTDVTVTFSDSNGLKIAEGRLVSLKKKGERYG